MAEADAVLVERLRNNDMLHAVRREMAALRQPRDTAIASGLLVGRVLNLNRAAIVRKTRGKCLRRDDRGGQPPFHVA